PVRSPNAASYSPRSFPHTSLQPKAAGDAPDIPNEPLLRATVLLRSSARGSEISMQPLANPDWEETFQAIVLFSMRDGPSTEIVAENQLSFSWNTECRSHGEGPVCWSADAPHSARLPNNVHSLSPTFPPRPPPTPAK